MFRPSKIIKFILISLTGAPPIAFLNTGFANVASLIWIQTAFFIIIFSSVLTYPQIRMHYWKAAFLLIIIMVVFYIFQNINLANIAGSSSVGIIFILLLSYLPQLVKLGYIKKI